MASSDSARWNEACWTFEHGQRLVNTRIHLDDVLLPLDIADDRPHLVNEGRHMPNRPQEGRHQGLCSHGVDVRLGPHPAHLRQPLLETAPDWPGRCRDQTARQSVPGDSAHPCTRPRL